jgi:hypothetical protein
MCQLGNLVPAKSRGFGAKQVLNPLEHLKYGLSQANTVFTAPMAPKADPEAERRAAEADAAQSASARSAATRRRRQQSSLLASGAPSGAPAMSSVLAYGKSTLGGT